MLSFPIKPMLLQSSEKPFNSESHIFEWKVDTHAAGAAPAEE